MSIDHEYRDFMDGEAAKFTIYDKLPEVDSISISDHDSIDNGSNVFQEELPGRFLRFLK